MSLFQHLSAYTLLFALCAPFPVRGQQQEDVPVVTSMTAGQSSVPYLLPEVAVTATREERLLFEVPHAVTTIEPEELARQTPGTLPDLLRGTTGVFVQQTTAGKAAPIIRGLIGSSVLMLVDGMRLNSTFFRPAPNQYFALIDPYVSNGIVSRGVGTP